MTKTMEFGYTDDHDLVRKEARRLFEQKCPRGELRKRAAAAPGIDRALHAEIARLGWIGLALPETAGGAGMDLLALAMVVEEMGRALTPTPFLGTVLAALTIERAGSREQAAALLPPVIDGRAIATVGLTEPGGSWEPEAVTARAEPHGDGYRLTGEKTHVMTGGVADRIVAPFAVGGELALFCVALDAPGVAVVREDSIDPSRPAVRVVFNHAPVDRATRLDSGNLDAVRWLHRLGWTLAAAELVGSAETVLAITRDYANERIQFDRPIGAFQAVKHPLVNVMIDLEMARSLVVGAAHAVHTGAANAERTARMAKAAATDTLLFACDRGIQLHGGFGFTWDCDVHFYYKRALWGAATLGDGRHHRRHLARLLAERTRG